MDRYKLEIKQIVNIRSILILRVNKYVLFIEKTKRKIIGGNLHD